MVYDFGIRLKMLRESKKLTQEQVAKRLNMTKASISGYEHNIATPSLEVLRQLCFIYGVSADYLLGIDHRKAIVIDDLTLRQEMILTDLVNTLLVEFTEKNKMMEKMKP